jgi:YD repeat-containing protein
MQYDGQGLLSSVILHPVNAGKNLTEWQQTKVDRKGRPIELTDYTGAHIQLRYDEWDALSSVVQQTQGGNFGYNIKRNPQGRIEAVNSSWGNTLYTYTNDGNLQRVTTTRGNRSALVDFLNGRVHTITGFDGARTFFDYHTDGPLKGMPKRIICPNSISIDYHYSENILSAVDIGNTRRIKYKYDRNGEIIGYSLHQILN